MFTRITLPLMPDGARIHDVGQKPLDPILDACVAEYVQNLDEDAQVKFKGNAKAFVRSYGFLAAILPYGHPEKLSIFLNLLIPKLPAPKEEDLSKGGKVRFEGLGSDAAFFVGISSYLI